MASGGARRGHDSLFTSHCLFIFSSHTVKPDLQDTDLLGKALVLLAQGGYDRREVQKKDEEKYDRQQEQERGRVINSQISCYGMQQGSGKREDDQHHSGSQPDEAVSLLEMIAPYEFDDNDKNSQAAKDSNDLNKSCHKGPPFSVSAFVNLFDFLEKVDEDRQHHLHHIVDRLGERYR